MNELKSINPDLDCASFDDESEYCVSGETSDDQPTATTTTTKAAETTTTTSKAAETTTAVTTSSSTSSTKTTQTATTTSSASDHDPTQPGLADNCDKFHKFADGDSCDAIEASAGITHAQFSKWNPYINDSEFLFFRYPSIRFN